MDAQRVLLSALGFLMPQRQPSGPPMTVGNMHQTNETLATYVIALAPIFGCLFAVLINNALDNELTKTARRKLNKHNK
jgi:hypothetical protein